MAGGAADCAFWERDLVANVDYMSYETGSA